MAKIIDKNGYWKYPNTKISREGVFPYAGWQIDDSLPPDQIFMVYRPYEEISKQETVDSFNGVPFIEDHEMIGSGFTPVDERPAAGTLYNTRPQPNDLFGDIVVYSEKVKDSISAGKKELSLGYFCSYVLEKGVFDGQPYDYKQINLLGNHIALVDKGRMGSSVRVQDSATGKMTVVDLTKKNAQDSLNLKKHFQVEGAHSLRLVFDTITTTESEYMAKPKVKKGMPQKLAGLLVSMAADAALDDKVSNLLFAAFDANEEGEKAKDEKVDKRELIREVMAIAAKKNDEFKGGESEKIETIAKKLEEMSYNKSEAGNGDKSKDKDPDDKDGKGDKSKDDDKTKDACGGKDDDPDKNDDKKSQDKGMDAAAIMKAIADADDLYTSVRQFTGDFEHRGKTAHQIAVDAAKILKIECSEDEALPTVKGYVKAQENFKTATIDQSDKTVEDSTEDAALAEYLKGE